MAEQIVRSHVTVTGVQPKLSLTLAAIGDAGNRLAHHCGRAGRLHPKAPYPALSQPAGNKNLTMHLAALAGWLPCPTACCAWKGAYATRRIDRHRGQKLAMEDMCWLMRRLTENKYNGSHEQVAKAILRYSSNLGLDMVTGAL